MTSLTGLRAYLLLTLVCSSPSSAHGVAPEPDPAVLESVRDRTFGVREQESQAYYAVLQHARQVDHVALRAAARRNVESRISLLKQPDAEQELKRIERYAARSGIELLDPDQFPAFVDLFLHPDQYRGKAVTLRGYLRKLISYPAETPDGDGPRNLYEAWLFTDDSHGNPAVVVCSEIPEGMPTGEDINEQVSVTGYFFKMYGYRARDTTRTAPMILARELVWYPAAERAAWRPTALHYTLLGAGVLGLVLVVWRISRGDRRAGWRRLHAESEDAPPDFRKFDPDRA